MTNIIKEIKDMNNIVQDLNKDWHNFQEINDKRLKEIEQKGSSDPLTIEQLNKINHQLDKQRGAIETLAASGKRPVVDDKNPVSKAEQEYKSAFCMYLRHGIESERLKEEKSTLSQTKDAGYIATTHMMQQLNSGLLSYSPIRRLATTLEISRDALDLIEDSADNLAGWTQDFEDVQNNTKVSTLKKKLSIHVHELYAQPQATNSLLEDPVIDIEEWLSKKLLAVFTKKENAAFINGDGIGKPRGILHHRGDIKEIKSASKEGVTIEDLLNLVYSLPEIYSANAKFLMSRTALQAVRMLKDSTGRYIWQPSLALNVPETLFGSEVLVSNDIADTKGESVIYGDFKQGYYVVEKGGTRILRDPYTNKPYTKFYSTKRVGGEIVKGEALKILKSEA